MTVRRGTAAALGLIAVFALLTVSVIDARRPLERAVARSFDATAPGRAVGPGTIEPAGCRKAVLDYYDCHVRRSAGPGAPATRFTYRLWLRDDGCWTATGKGRPGAVSVPREVEGCLAE